MKKLAALVLALTATAAFAETTTPTLTINIGNTQTMKHIDSTISFYAIPAEQYGQTTKLLLLDTSSPNKQTLLTKINEAVSPANSNGSSVTLNILADERDSNGLEHCFVTQNPVSFRLDAPNEIHFPEDSFTQIDCQTIKSSKLAA